MWFLTRCPVSTPAKGTSTLGCSSMSSGKGSLLSIAMLWSMQQATVMVHTRSGAILTSPCKIWKRRFKTPNDLSIIDLVVRRARLNLLWDGVPGS